MDVLGVAQETVDEHGVVSAACAEEMAAGARRLLGTTYAVSTTGVAGPERQEGKPVGTVYVGVAGPHGVRAVGLALDGDRPTVQEASVDAALSALADMIGSDTQPAEDSGLG
ncbi:CinA family protein [Nocardioides convexus]|uniref:CinA family protein n=1 Tax=Nocardioides convexus TaxID=2712224 RepID=UPI00241828C4|nr:CinA family protein [Nocardioides convexus]